MSDTPKFQIVDRRRMKAEEEEQASHQAETAAVPAPESRPEIKPEPSHGGPRLVVSEGRPVADPAEHDPDTAATAEIEVGAGFGEGQAADQDLEQGLPPVPNAEAIRQQAVAYEAAAQRLEELIRAQNPAVGAQPAMSFEQLVQQFYVSAMIQMGAGAQEGQRPRVDILGARTTIDMLGILQEKTQGNRSPTEDRALEAVLYEVRMAFLELTSMISLQAMQPPQPPPPGAR